MIIHSFSCKSLEQEGTADAPWPVQLQLYNWEDLFLMQGAEKVLAGAWVSEYFLVPGLLSVLFPTSVHSVALILGWNVKFGFPKPTGPR